MPVPMLKSFAQKSGKSLSDLERYWDEAKKQAVKEGKAENYQYIVGIVKRRAGISEDFQMSRADKILNLSETKDVLHTRLASSLQSVFHLIDQIKQNRHDPKKTHELLDVLHDVVTKDLPPLIDRNQKEIEDEYDLD